jgi:transposase InsO family protein
VTRYRWVAAREAEGFPITKACEVAGVSRQAFYEWNTKTLAGPSRCEVVEARLVETMREIHRDDDTVGSPRMTAALNNLGWDVNHKRVERLMRVHGIVGIPQKRTVRTTLPAEDTPPVPDLVGRRFAPGRPDWAWCSDITYIPTGEGWLYLATVIDIGSRRLLGYSMADHMRASLVTAALDMAIGIRTGCCDDVIFHSDRGSQYLSAEVRVALADAGMLQSVGRTGVCWDNALAEAWFGTLKRELVSRVRFATRADARRAIFGWINRYNHRRLHSSLGYQTPTQWEDQYRRSHRHDQAA